MINNEILKSMSGLLLNHSPVSMEQSHDITFAALVPWFQIQTLILIPNPNPNPKQYPESYHNPKTLAQRDMTRHVTSDMMRHVTFSLERVTRHVTGDVTRHVSESCLARNR